MSTEINFPDVNVPITGSQNLVENSDQKVLFVGQKLAAGTASVGLTKDVPASTLDINTLIGRGSHLQQMLVDARLENSVCSFDMIVVADGVAATAATATLTFVGTATEDGSILTTIGSKRKGKITTSILDTSSETVVAAGVAASITADLDSVVTAGNVAGVLTLTSKNLGALYNAIGIACEVSVAGITVTISANGFSGGTVDPDLSSVMDAVGDDRYQTVCWGYDSDNTTIKDFMDARFNVTDDVQDGIAIVVKEDTFANLQTLGNGLNSNSFAVMGVERGAGTTFGDSFELPWSKNAQFCAIRALRRQPDANIGSFVIGGGLDAIGGPALSSKPMANTPMRLIPTIETNRGFTALEQKALRDAGVFVIGNNKAGNLVIMSQVVMTYKTDSAGNPDPTFKFMNYVDTSSSCREYISNNLEAAYAQHRLTDGDTVGGRSMTSALGIEGFITGLYQNLAGSDFVLARKGEANLQFFKENINVTVDLATGTATAPFSLPIVTQLRRINAPITIVFNLPT